MVVATPAPGFTADIGEAHDGGARVEFESDDHRSRLDGWWDGGPQDEVREDATDGVALRPSPRLEVARGSS